MMIRLVFRTICLFVIIDYVKGAKIGSRLLCLESHGNCCHLVMNKSVRIVEEVAMVATNAPYVRFLQKLVLKERKNLCLKATTCVRSVNIARMERRNVEQIVSLESLKQPVNIVSIT